MAEPLSKSLMHWAEVAQGCGNEERADLMRHFADRAAALERRLEEAEKAVVALPVLRDHCACGLLEWHEHDAEDADWFGPSGWFRKWPTDPAPDFCPVCGTRVGPGNVAYPSPLYKGAPAPAPEGGPE